MFRIYGSFETKYFLKYDKSWQLSDNYFFKAKTEVEIKEEVAWRIFTKGINYDEAKNGTRVKGDEEIGFHILSMIAIMG